MNEIKRQYDPVILDNIKKVLENEHKRGKARYFDIWIDGLKVVEKTNDLEQFDAHEENMNDLSERVVINLYTATPTSAHIQSRYVLSMKEEIKPQVQTLNGYSLGEVEARIDEKVSLAKERWDCDQVRRDLDATKERLKESEEYSELLTEKLDKAVEEAKSAKNAADFANILKGLAVPIITKKFGEHVDVLSGTEKPKEEASFQMKDQESSITEQEKGYIAFGQFVNTSFTQEESGMIVDMIHALAADKKNIPTVCSLLNINKENKNTK